MSQPIAFYTPVPAREGAEWVQLSWRIFRAHWPRYIGLTSLYLLLMQMCAAIVGPLCMLLNPILSVGFLAAAWHHERGELPEVKHLFAGFKSNLRALLPLGGVHLIGLLVALTVGLLASGLTLDQLKGFEEQGNVPQEALMRVMLVTLAITLPLTAALWFSPALIVFSDASFGQAIGASVRASLANWLSMSVYGIAMFGLTVLAVVLVSPLLYLLPAKAVLTTVMLLVVPLTAIRMISDYVCYRRVFHREERVDKVAGAA